jgi:glycerol-3-phosphate acyltransferase PlsY
MNPTIATLIAVVAAYLIGSISFAVVISRLFGLADPRTYGSKNPGATNVLRSGSKKAAIMTLLLDALKGWLPVWLVVEFGGRYGIGDDGVALVMLAVFLGHLYPLYFRFVGGKGVATALGVLFALYWWLGLFTLMTWIVIAFFFRYASLASIAAAVFAPFFYVLLNGTDIIAAAMLVMSALLIYRHRKNIANLMAGKEGRLGAKKTAKKA